MSQSDYYSQASDNESIKDKVSDAADAVQQASVDTYEAVRDTAQDQPFFAGLLVGALVGFALGALWKLESRRSLPAHMLDSLHSYANPSMRYLRNRVGW
jgi:hypothetical protein